MTEGEDNVELGGNSSLYYAMTGDGVPLIDGGPKPVRVQFRLRRKAWAL